MCILHDVTRKCLYHYHMSGDMSANLIGQYNVPTIDHSDAQNRKNRALLLANSCLEWYLEGWYGVLSYLFPVGDYVKHVFTVSMCSNWNQPSDKND